MHFSDPQLSLRVLAILIQGICPSVSCGCILLQVMPPNLFLQWMHQLFLVVALTVFLSFQTTAALRYGTGENPTKMCLLCFDLFFCGKSPILSFAMLLQIIFYSIFNFHFLFNFQFLGVHIFCRICHILNVGCCATLDGVFSCYFFQSFGIAFADAFFVLLHEGLVEGHLSCDWSGQS